MFSNLERFCSSIFFYFFFYGKAIICVTRKSYIACDLFVNTTYRRNAIVDWISVVTTDFHKKKIFWALQLEELEGSSATKEEIAEKLLQSGLRLREVERSLQITKRDVTTYQGMLQQSQVRRFPNQLSRSYGSDRCRETEK